MRRVVLQAVGGHVDQLQRVVFGRRLEGEVGAGVDDRVIHVIRGVAAVRQIALLLLLLLLVVVCFMSE